MNEEEPTLRTIRRKAAKSIAENATPHRIEATNAKLALAVIETLAMTGSVKQCCQKHGVGHLTVKRIGRTHKEVIVDWREYSAGEAFLLKQRTQAMMHKKLDMMEDDEEQIKKTGLRDFAQAASMMAESYMAAMGEGPKANVTVNIGPSIEDVQRHLEELRAKISGRPIKQVEPTIVDI